MADVPVIRLAEEWHITRSTARKYVLARGFTPKKVRDPASRGQWVLVVSTEEANRLRKIRIEETINLS